MAKTNRKKKKINIQKVFTIIMLIAMVAMFISSIMFI